MSLPISTSPDITLLDFAILYDLSSGTPSITLTNQSVGNPSGSTNLDNCDWWYTITTPSGVYIHQGTEASPDVTADDWTTLTIPSGSWPTPFGAPPYGQVEFSCGVPYSTTLYVKDSDGNIFNTTKQVTICRPPGNTEKTLGSFGVANVEVTVKCAEAKIYTLDQTNYTYQNTIGTFNSNTWTLVYPMDSNDNIPAPVVVQNQGRVIFGVGYNAQGYQIYLNTKATYDMGDSQTIKLQYKFKDVFSVYCSSNLCEIQCQIEGLRKLTAPNCGTVKNTQAQAKLDQINTLAVEALIGINQPGCGIDVPAIVQKIKAIGGFDCGCSMTGGINPIASTDGSINIELALTGLTGSVSNVGDNYTITLASPGATGTLQEVTDNGNETTKDIIIGNSAAAHMLIEPSRIQGKANAGEVYAGLGQAQPSDTVGSLWMRALSNGTVYFQPDPNSNTYILQYPVAQGATGEALILVSPGVYAWATPGVGTLQLVTDGVGNNVTTNDMISGVEAGDHVLVSDTNTGLYNGVTELIAFLNVTGAPRLRIRDIGSAFSITIPVPTLAANRIIRWPGIRSGDMALSGFGTTMTATADTGAGTGPTLTVLSGSTHLAGGITVLTGSVPAAAGTIVKLSTGIQYVAGGIVWRGVISPGNTNAAALSGTSAVSVQSPQIAVSGDELWINAGSVALAATTSYTWYWVNGF